MIKLILILIIIILLSVIVTKEHFDDFVDSNHCNFIAWGPTKKKCISSCLYSTLKSHYDKYKKCSESECTNVCGACDKKNLCQWIDNEEPPISGDSSGEDTNQIKLKFESINNKIKLTWNVDEGKEISSYLIHYKDEEEQPLHTIDNGILTSKDFDIKENKKYIPTVNLKEESVYKFIVYGLLKSESELEESNCNKDSNSKCNNRIIKSNKIYVNT
jgi:hypothetical protein